MEFSVARQPILDREKNVFAYELLFGFAQGSEVNKTNADRATAQVITGSFDVIGIKSLTDEKMAFINFTENFLKQEMVTVIPKELIGVEILEDIKLDQEILSVCKKLKNMGYLLVLDDFVFREELSPLIEIADIIKIDFLETPAEERARLVEEFQNDQVKFLAEKVESREDFQQAFELGYTYFQGYFFSEPDIVSGKDVPTFKNNYLYLLKEINQPEIDFDRIEEIIKGDISLLYKIFRLVNSAAFGLKFEITSIRRALILIGLNEVKKWLSLNLLCGLGEDKPDILVVNSLIRAKLAELTAPMIGLRNRSLDFFIMGMFSMIDAFLDRPLEDILNDLPLAKDVELALLKNKGPLSQILNLIKAYERGHWDQVNKYTRKLNIDESQFSRNYLEAVSWTNEIIYDEEPDHRSCGL